MISTNSTHPAHQLLSPKSPKPLSLATQSNALSPSAFQLWPRGAALAERLWTNPSHNWEPAETRLIHQRQRMVARGIMADRIQPQWCHQNEGLCYLKGIHQGCQAMGDAEVDGVTEA